MANEYRAVQWEKIVNLLEEIDVIQQNLIDDESISYRLHQVLGNIADECTDLAKEEGIVIA